MIFDKDGAGKVELRNLTGSYFLNNEFGKVAGQIELVTEEVKQLIGSDVYKKAETAYHGTPTEEQQEFIKKVQRPIAILATLRMYQRNDLSHEDSGRKFKIATDDSEKLPWEWQLDRDDERHLEDYYRAIDALVRYLNDSGMEEWKNSDRYKQLQKMLIRNGREFDGYYPIDGSERTFLLLLPFIREAEMLHTRRNYGAGWDELVANREEDKGVRFAACKATALYAMAMAFKRMQLSIFPVGVVRRYLNENGASNSSAATVQNVKLMAEWLEEDAATWMDEMKRSRDGEEVHYNMLPKNDPKNKFCSL